MSLKRMKEEDISGRERVKIEAKKDKESVGKGDSIEKAITNLDLT